MIYLDHAAGTPVRKEVLQTMRPYFAKEFANPSSIHETGQKARKAVEEAREIVRKILHADTDDKIIFTSGGTESINLALQGVAHRISNCRIITSTIEHEAVLETVRKLEKENFPVEYVPVDEKGIVNLAALEKILTGKILTSKNNLNSSIFISIMYVNNEVGTIQPIKEIAQITKRHKIIFHTDACQAGYEELNVQKLGVDLLTLNGSKINGPKGAGILYARKGIALEPLFYGGGQEYGLRSGTENVPAVIGFAKALELMQKEGEKENEKGKFKLKKLRDLLTKELLKIPESKLNGHPSELAAHIVSVSFAGIEGEQLVRHLSEQGIYCSSGSACTSKKIAVSHVLQAMHVPEKFARGTVRFSLGKENTLQDIKKVVEAVKEVVEVLRKV